MFGTRTKTLEKAMQEQFGSMRQAFAVNPPLYFRDLNVSLDVALKEYRAVYFDDMDALQQIFKNVSLDECALSKTANNNASFRVFLLL